jgi:catechol 2,3-dioxygenase-like lactoylglutathione lyase family enzyme
MSDGVTGLGGVFFRADTDYFGASGQGFIVNQEGIGRFGWAADPEGNSFELREPAEGM